jgi:uncharacterized coiled-coil protein SlyX
MSEEQKTETPESTSADPATLDAIDVDAPVEERERQARKVFLKMKAADEPDLDFEVDDGDTSDDGKPDDDAAGDTSEPEKKRTKGPSLAERERAIKKLERKLAKQQKEIEESLAKLKSGDPIDQLKAAGHDTSSLIDKLIKGDTEQKPDKVSDLEKKIIELESKVREKEQQTAYNAAIGEIKSKISDDAHVYLSLEDDPARIVMDYIVAEYDNNGNELTADEAIDTIEAYYAQKAEKIEQAKARRAKKETKKPNNPTTRGGSANRKKWEDLSVRERELAEIRRLNALLAEG